MVLISQSYRTIHLVDINCNDYTMLSKTKKYVNKGACTVGPTIRQSLIEMLILNFGGCVKDGSQFSGGARGLRYSMYWQIECVTLRISLGTSSACPSSNIL